MCLTHKDLDVQIGVDLIHRSCISQEREVITNQLSAKEISVKMNLQQATKLF